MSEKRVIRIVGGPVVPGVDYRQAGRKLARLREKAGYGYEKEYDMQHFVNHVSRATEERSLTRIAMAAAERGTVPPTINIIKALDQFFALKGLAKAGSVLHSFGYKDDGTIRPYAPPLKPTSPSKAINSKIIRKVYHEFLRTGSISDVVLKFELSLAPEDVRAALRDEKYTKMRHKCKPLVTPNQYQAAELLLSGVAKVGDSTIENLLEKPEADRTSTKLARIKRGQHCCGNIPYGYGRTLKDGEYVLVENPAEAKVVRTIFEQYLELQSLDKLVKYLDDRNIRTRKGFVWSKPALTNLIRNVVYIGKVHYMGHEAQGNHDAIVTTSLFSLVGEILDTHGHRLGRDHVEPTSLGLESITQSQGHPNQEATTAKEMSNPYRT